MNNSIYKIENQIWNTVNTETRIGVLDGLSGIALFYSYLTKIIDNEEYQTKLITVVDRIGFLISEYEYDSSFCAGIAGYGWVLLKINNKNIEIDDNYFDSIDLILSETLSANSENNYYDFLYGGIGIAMYFIERYKVNKNKIIETALIEFTNELLRKINSEIDILFTNPSEIPENKYYYFGLAHGISGFLNFLIRLKDTIKNLIPNIDSSLFEIIDFMSRFKKYDSESKQFYPAQVLIYNNDTSSSRLGWCQGDLGIGNAIYNSGLFLNNKVLQDEGIELIHNSKKISIKESKVIDFGICHGSSGLMLQYYLASKKLNQNYSKIIDVWYENLKKQTNDFGSFDSFFIDKYMPETNILNGATGLALVLLTIENKIETDWSECLNLQ